MSQQLQSISVKNLFGNLNYSVEELETDAVLFVIGKNGMGKSTILQMIDGLANLNWEVYERTVFDQIEFKFLVNGETRKLTIRKLPANKSLVWDMESTERTQKYTPVPYIFTNTSTDHEKVLWLAAHRSDVTLASCGRHWEIEGSGHYDDYEVIEKLGSEVPLSEENIEKMGFLANWKVSLIAANRLELITPQNSSSRSNRIREHRSQGSYTVNIISKEMVTLMNEHLITAQEFGHTLEQDFLAKLLATGGDDTTKEIEVAERLEKVNSLEKRLQEYGLYPETANIELPSRKLEGSDLRLLAAYLDNKEQKLEPHVEFLNRLVLFESLINTSIAYKQINADKIHGIRAVSEFGDTALKLEKLSSGEQQLIILAYKLLFEVPSSSYILIDEPELSMHMAWQKKFASMLDDIGQTRNSRYLCATHSPAITNRRLSKLRDIK